MSLQIFTKPKCQESRKAERYFKERRIPYQLCDLSRRALSRREYEAIRQAAGGMWALIDEKSKLYETLYLAYLSEESAVEKKLLEHPLLFRTPIVRLGRLVTVGYQPEIWRTWENF